MTALSAHLRALAGCERCPAMHKPVVIGRPVASRILLIGQAPGVKEPQFGRLFAWTAGKTLFRWIESALGWDEETARNRIYFAAVCRCFPGKNPRGGDRVPSEKEIQACSHWLDREFEILQPSLSFRSAGSRSRNSSHSIRSRASLAGPGNFIATAASKT